MHFFTIQLLNVNTHTKLLRHWLNKKKSKSESKCEREKKKYNFKSRFYTLVLEIISKNLQKPFADIPDDKWKSVNIIATKNKENSQWKG